MKKFFYSLLTLVLGLVLSGSGCNTDDIDPDGVLINGIVWARYNVGEFGKFVESPEDPGHFYQWDNITPWPPTGPFSWVTFTSSLTSWTPSYDPCPTGWKLPSMSDFIDLFMYDEGWDAVHKGRNFATAPTNGIFLPAAGYRLAENGELTQFQLSGNYWTREQLEDTKGLYISFSSAIIGSGGLQKGSGLSVRCVKE